LEKSEFLNIFSKFFLLFFPGNNIIKNRTVIIQSPAGGAKTGGMKRPPGGASP
jgi:hypothetical protein